MHSLSYLFLTRVLLCLLLAPAISWDVPGPGPRLGSKKSQRDSIFAEASDSQTLLSAINDRMQDAVGNNFPTLSEGLGSVNSNNGADFIFRSPAFFTSMQKSLGHLHQHFRWLIMYKPPVGATLLGMGIRILFFGKGRKGLLHALQEAEEKKDGAVIRTKRRGRRRGRSLDLDAADNLYDIYGGIESTRTQLYRMALMSLLEKELLVLDGSQKQESLRQNVLAALDGVTISCPPRGSREVFIEQLCHPLSQLTLYLNEQGLTVQVPARVKKSADSEGFLSNDMIEEFTRDAAKVTEIRALDAMLRVLRDRLLASSARLRRARNHWKWRVRWHSQDPLGRLLAAVRKFLRNMTLEDDRRSLALANAAYDKEAKLLGEVQQMLMERPVEMSNDELLKIKSSFNSGNASAIFETRSAIGIITGEERVAGIAWAQEAHQWTLRARNVICSMIETSLRGLEPSTVTSPSKKRNTTVADDIISVTEWCTYEGSGDINQWIAVTSLVDNFDKARRKGESSGLLVPNFKYWTNRIDFYGIPSSFIAIGVAMYVHETIKPHWGKIKEFGIVSRDAIWGVIEFRFYTPLRDIILDLLNKRSRMLDPFAVRNEQESLDNMLRDLGVGDGSASNRKEAIAAASRMYEEELRAGPLKGFLMGRVLRLLLIQVQQLKADMLLAMDSIDDLVESNRINVQLLAGIPAFLIVTYGVRVFFRWIYFIRTQDIRPIKGVHGEMSDYLDRIERSLLLAHYEEEVAVVSNSKFAPIITSQEKAPRLFLATRDLGEVVILIHSYLVLLDYCSPPFPSQVCDSIHKLIQDLLIPGKLSIQRQLDLLRLVKAKHIKLLKS